MEKRRHQRRPVSQAQWQGPTFPRLPDLIHKSEGRGWVLDGRCTSSVPGGTSLIGAMTTSSERDSKQLYLKKPQYCQAIRLWPSFHMKTLPLGSHKAGFKCEAESTNTELLELYVDYLICYSSNFYKCIQRNSEVTWQNIQPVKGGALMQNQVSWLNSVLLLPCVFLPLEKGKSTHSCSLTWGIPWTA